jgi:hypothetical protein
MSVDSIGQISVISDSGDCYESLLRKYKFGRTGQKCQALYRKTKVCFLGAGDIMSQ